MAKSAGDRRSRAMGSLFKESSLPSLDGIRALSCIWVSSSHSLFLWSIAAPQLFQPVYARWWPVAIPFNGDIGVDCFLLLSGYLIGRGVLEEIARSGSFAWRRFLVRRVLRIAPVFYLAVGLAVAANGREACAGVWRQKLFFVEDVAANLQDGGSCVPQSWSVAVEMQLYLLTPWVVLAAFRAGGACGAPPARVLLAACAALWAACCGARYAVLPDVLALTGSIWYTAVQYRCAPYLTGVATAALLFDQAASPAAAAAADPADGASGTTAVALLRATLSALAWAALLFFALYGGGGPLLGFESPMAQYPFGVRAAKLHFVLGRPLIGAAASYLLWEVLSGRAPRLHSLLAAPAWRPLARLSYSAYMMQVVNFALGLYLLSFLGQGGPAAQALSALPALSLYLLLYAWLLLYGLFAFALALPCYAFLEYPGMACGRRLAATLRPPAAACRELEQPLV